LNDVLQEKEAYIDQLSIQMEGLNHEVESLTDFQVNNTSFLSSFFLSSEFKKKLQNKKFSS